MLHKAENIAERPGAVRNVRSFGHLIEEMHDSMAVESVLSKTFGMEDAVEV